MRARHSGSVTLSDVARRAGVGLSTASAVLRGASNRMSAETRGRIVQSARDLGYQPNAVARGLARGRTNIIGFYLGHDIPIDDPFFVEIHCGLEAGCKVNRKHLLIYGGLNENGVDEAHAELMNGMASALVVYSLPGDPLAARLAESHIPLVSITDPLPNMPAVVADDAAGARLQAKHLAARGHRRILYRNARFPYPAVVRQYAAFREAAAGFGMTVTETKPEPKGHLTDEERSILALPVDKRPTAAVCWTDYYAYDLLDYCRNNGIRVPDDLAVIGYDGFRVAFAKTEWDLTTIRVPWREVAATAVSILVAALDGREIPAETMLPTTLVAGKTT